MNDKSIILEAALDEDFLKIDMHQPDEVIWDYDYSLVPMEKVNKTCTNILETINRMGKINRPDPKLKDRLIQGGRSLCQLLIQPKVEKKLRVTDADTIIAVIDDKLIHIPWELIYFDQEFLCRRFCMGRKVKTRQNLPDIKKKSCDTKKIWIIADPSNELKNAESEGVSICQYIDDVVPHIEPVFSGRVTLDDIQNDIRQYDIVHFAGHVDYFTDDLQKNGWRLTEGRFTISDIDQMAGTVEMPSFIFANACQSALTNVSIDCDHAYPNISGMANAFLVAGVNHYIGTLWEIDDNQSRYFAIRFYNYLLSGLTIGESIRLSRIDFDEEFGAYSIGWASYLLYGDPQERYADTSESQSDIRGKSDASASTYTPKKMKQFINKYFLFIPVIVLIFFVMYFLFNKHSDTVVIPAQVLETLEKLAISKQKEIERILDRIEHKMNLNFPKQAISLDNWTSTPLTVVVDFVSSSHQLNLVKENMILATIQEAIIKDTHFKCLERIGFLQLLKELDLSLTHPLHKLKRQPEMMSPNFFLFITIDKINTNLFIYMRLSEMNRSVYDAWFERIESERSIVIQKSQLSQRLINNLKQIEKNMISALQGKIAHIKEQEIVINIGNNEGVFPGQIFRVVDTDTFLEVEIVQKSKSIAKVFKGDPTMTIGQRIIAKQQKE